MREFLVQGLTIVLLAIGFGVVAHVIFMVFSGFRPTPESHKTTSFWNVFMRRSRGHVVTQLVLFALMVIVFIALGWLNKQHPMPLSR